MALPTSIHLYDIRANQPAAAVGNAGVIFCVTDEGNILERSNGTTWDAYSPDAVDLSNIAITGGSIIGITDLAVADGGTGVSTLTAYAPIFGGTTGTAPVQSGTVGTATHVLTSNGPGALPTFQAPAAGGTELKGLTFTSDTGSTADSDPGNGLFKWNNATQASATKLFFDDLSLDGISLATFFTGLPATGYIYIQQGDDSTIWQLWKWTSVTNDTGYRDFAVTLQAKSTADIADNKTVYCDFKPDSASGGSAGALVLLESHTASASSTLDFTTRNAAGQSGATIQSDYDSYMIEGVDIIAGTNGESLRMRVGTGGGPTFDTGSNYQWTRNYNIPGGTYSWAGSASNGSDTAMTLMVIVSSTGPTDFTMKSRSPGNAYQKFFTWEGKQQASDGAFYDNNPASGRYTQTTALTAFRFFLSAGTFSGTIRVYGIAK